MGIERSWKIGIGYLIVGATISTAYYIDGNIASMIVGILFVLTGINLLSMKYIPIEHKTRIFMDIGTLLMSIGLIIYGYLSTGGLIFMIIMMLLIILPIIMFLLRRHGFIGSPGSCSLHVSKY
ncbi:MAG: hypothetical protein QXI93_03760 [Candidatus Methanomethylicia archaeon]